MTTTRLLATMWQKPWGRTHIGLLNGRHVRGLRFSPLQGKRLPLLIKYIFTAEKLSVQVRSTDA